MSATTSELSNCPLSAQDCSEQGALPPQGPQPPSASRSQYLTAGLHLSSHCHCPPMQTVFALPEGTQSLSPREAGLGSGVCTRYKAQSLLLNEGTVPGHVERQWPAGNAAESTKPSHPRLMAAQRAWRGPSVDTEEHVIFFLWLVDQSPGGASTQ